MAGEVGKPGSNFKSSCRVKLSVFSLCGPHPHNQVP